MNNINYIYGFFVGMMDGDGSIQVNHWKKKILQFRLVIKLKYTYNNENMLYIFKKYIGGNVRISFSKKEKMILWVENDKQKILEICKIFEKYRLLTFRKNAQLHFLYKCVYIPTYTNMNEKKYTLKTENYFENFLIYRKNKYTDLYKVLQTKSTRKHTTHVYDYSVQKFTVDSENIYKYDYFASWLSGFIEAVGLFSITESTYHSFCIRIKHDAFLLKAIILFFDLHKSVKIRKLKIDFYVFEIYKKLYLYNIISHFKNNPLLGEKKVSYEKLNSSLINK